MEQKLFTFDNDKYSITKDDKLENTFRVCKYMHSSYIF